MRIALFSPLNPIETGISDYTEELLFELEKYFDIDLYIAQGYTPSNMKIQSHFNIVHFNPRTFNPSKYDEIIYHMGNNYAGHYYIYEALIKYPGIVVLHDYVLQGFYAERFSETGNFNEYLQLLKKYYFQKGEQIAQDIVERMPVPIWETEKAIEYPLNEEILEYAKVLIVHSNFVGERVKKVVSKPVVKINHHEPLIKPFNVDRVRQRLKLKKEDILLCSAGFVNRNKRYDVILSAISELNNPRIKYMIAGKDSGNILQNLLQEKENNILIRRHLPLRDLESLISASDICINLRFPTMGESSGSLLRMMAYGKPTLVTNFGSYTEIPDYCVLKIDPDINEKEMLKRYIISLIDDIDFGKSVGREAREYVRKECSIKKCAHEYAEYIKEQKRN